MSIEIIGDPELLRAMGVPGNQASESPLGNLVNVEPGPEPIATVKIPDVRFQHAGTKTSDQPQIKLETNRTPPLTGLDKIKQAIEKTLESDPVSAIEELQSALESTQEQASDPIDIEIRQTHADEVSQDEGMSGGIDCCFTSIDRQDKQIRPIVDSILEKFPLTGTSFISFTCSENNAQLGAVVTHSAAVLENIANKPILIIDFDVDNNSLTTMLGIENQPGIFNLKRQGVSWEQIIQKTSQANIDVVSLGRMDSASNISETIRDTVGAIGNDYNFVLVNVGDAHGQVAQAWAKHVHGTFLLVSMAKSNQHIAKSAVAQLNSSGARLIGCVVSQQEDEEN